MRCISNIAAGNSQQIMQLIESGILSQIAQFLDDINDHETHVEIKYTVENLVDCISEEYDQMWKLFNAGILQAVNERLLNNTVKDVGLRSSLSTALMAFEKKCKCANVQIICSLY